MRREAANAISQDEFMSTHAFADETAFTGWVIGLARAHGWLAHHVRTSLQRSGRWSTAVQGDTGFPDLVLVSPEGRTLFVELKMARGRFEPKQELWIERLRAGGEDARVWRPSDWRAIEETLGVRR